jgi:putative exosortase-associated protein (TIGR04073 family)
MQDLQKKPEDNRITSMLSCCFDGCQSSHAARDPFLDEDHTTMRRRTRILAIAWLMWTLVIPQARAQDPPPQQSPIPCPICQAANNQATPYPQRAGVSLLRGATNATFGWTELLLQPTAEAEQGGNLAAGVGRGIGMAVKRTAVGFGELFTFWVPKGKQGYPILTEDCPICTLPKVPAPKSSPAPSSRQTP